MGIRVAIVDDHASFTQALTLYFSQRARDLSVVGVAHTAEDGIETALQQRPDVIVMDLRLPDGNGLDAAVLIRKRLPAAKILMVTSEEGVASIAYALQAGIHGYLVKRVNADDIAAGIRAVHKGDLVFDAGARDAIIRLSQEPVGLDPLEQQLVRMVAGGKRNREIAAAMHVSLAAVKRSLHNLFAKLGVTNRTSAVDEARRRHLI